MADESAKTPEPIKKWAYPFKGKGDPKAKDAKATEVTDPKTYFEALATAEDGFYPIGANGLWHGGIHFGSQTGNVLSQDSGVRCIADGEVIAYRIDSAYPQVEYECGKATYSKGFVLVKHRLQLPPAPKKAATDAKTDDKAATPAKTDSKQTAEEPTLTFFSLYMHLLDWAGYEADKKRSRPGYWDGEKQYVVGSKSNDKEEKIAPGASGLRVRDGDSKPIAILPNGTKLTLGEEGAKKGYFAIASIVSGDSVPAGQSTGYVYKKELEVIATPKTKDAVAVLDKPAPIKAGELIGYLGQYQRYVDTSALACKDRPLVHVEVFSGDDVQGFIDKSKARGKELDAKQKTLLVLDKGTKLVLPTEPDHTVADGTDIKITSDSPKAGDWAKVQPLASTPAPTKKNPKAVKLAPTGDALWVQRTLLGNNGQRAATTGELKAWKQFPLQTSNATGPEATYVRVAAIKTLKKTAADDKGVRWWEIDVDTPDAKGNTLGWACETGHLQSPWEWPGFEIISETAVLTDLHGKQIIDQRLDTPADKDDFKAKAERAKEGELFQKLYDVIDADKKDGLTTDELRAALKKPWLAQTLSRVIARYESEWGGEMGKWDELDPHMGEKANDWAKEKGRIKELQWWDKLAGKHGFPGSPIAFHIHPVGAVANFLAKSHPTIILNGQSVELEFLDFYDGTTITDADYAQAATELGCEVAAIKAVAITESGASGSYFTFEGWDAVPAILYERHYFHRLTGGKYDQSHPDLSNSDAGGYGGYSAQYAKLVKAYELDQESALKSVSWGRFQIMGSNHTSAGSPDVGTFVRSISIAEKNHLSAFVSFIKSNSTLSKAIVDKDWLAFAISYNGPKQKGYDKRMKDNYEDLTNAK